MAQGKSAHACFVEDLEQHKRGVAPGISSHRAPTRPARPSRFAMLASQARRRQRLEIFRERLLIAFFGLGQLLNVQVGGFYGDYVPEPTVVSFFESHNMGFFKNFAQHTKPAKDETIDELADRQSFVKELFNDNPEATGTAQLGFPARTVDTLLDQAVLSHVNGIVPLVLVDLGYVDRLGREPGCLVPVARGCR
ncbi:BQ2448_387 [Microbotryum intermedium]|uniref:BQ2448_387 protein n=1 Tax=Microbotryum intermedium TaxID=269621 RepID=A0A238FB09_9BASI|nr:BQ2448_387 [Microbotryum intermedium]